MSRAFFDQIDDELRGLVGPALRDFHSVRTSRLIKIWYGDSSTHFEAQLVSRQWSPTRKPVIEVGLHLESRLPETNESILAEIGSTPGWKKKLRGAEAGPALGPRAKDWRRLSETVEMEGLDDPEFAGEVAERLAAYIKTLGPLLIAGKLDTPSRGRL